MRDKATHLLKDSSAGLGCHSPGNDTAKGRYPTIEVVGETE